MTQLTDRDKMKIKETGDDLYRAAMMLEFIPDFVKIHKTPTPQQIKNLAGAILDTLNPPPEEIIAQFKNKAIPINPALPALWDCTEHKHRPKWHRKLWGKPYISTYKNDDGQETFTVRRLDGGAWDRSTLKGTFKNLDDALLCAKSYQ